MSAEQSPKQAAKQASKQASGEGFIGRWSRLKRDTAAVEPLDVSATPRVPPSVAAAPGAEPTGDTPAAASTGAATRAATGAASGSPGQAAHDTDRPRQPGTILPSIESLGKDSDYSMFMKADVDPQLRLSALKKMFTDPHFNQMDGLDIYIDDYTKPDPIPLAMLKRLNQSRMLNLFQEEPAKDGVPPEPAGALADGAPEQEPRAALGSEDSQALRDVQEPVGVQASHDLTEPQEAAAADRSARLSAPCGLPATPGLPVPPREAVDGAGAPVTDFASPVSGKPA